MNDQANRIGWPRLMKGPATLEEACRGLYDCGYRRGLLEGLRLHLGAKFGFPGRKVVTEAILFLDDLDLVKAFAQEAWKKPTLRQVRACLYQAFQDQKSAARRST
jgi:hypothetical protein